MKKRYWLVTATRSTVYRVLAENDAEASDELRDDDIVDEATDDISAVLDKDQRPERCQAQRMTGSLALHQCVRDKKHEGVCEFGPRKASNKVFRR